MVKFAKDPWQTKETMKCLVDDNGISCSNDEDKLRALVDHNFFMEDCQSPEVLELDGLEEVPNLEELEGKVREALQGTSNRSAPGPDGISYRFIKAVLDTKLGRELIAEVAMCLREGRIPEDWQLSKVVFIPKPSKNHQAAKGWCPINLINCIGKLVEKVVADELQMAGLFHEGQYGRIKGRSAIEAMMRVLTRAQRAIARGGQAVWLMEDVKGGFNNVIGHEVLDTVAKSSKKGWCKWLAHFFRQGCSKWNGTERSGVGGRLM